MVNLALVTVSVGHTVQAEYNVRHVYIEARETDKLYVFSNRRLDKDKIGIVEKIDDDVFSRISFRVYCLLEDVSHFTDLLQTSVKEVVTERLDLYYAMHRRICRDDYEYEERDYL